MKRFVYLTIALSALLVGACSKKDSNNIGYAPNNCVASGGPNQYRMLNGQCVNAQNQVVSQNMCYGYNTYDPRCGSMTIGPNQFGAYGFNGFGYAGVGDTCSMYYGPGWVTSRGIYGELICVNAASWGYITGYYGVPAMYGPAGSGYYQTCIPGQNNCNCQSVGGTLGTMSGSANTGYCY